MSQELVKSRSYLADHRKMIIGRALATATAGALPIPLVDDWLSSTIARGTIRRLAEDRGVDIDDDAIKAIADGPEAPPNFADIAGGGLALKILSRQWRKLVIAVLAARRARAAAKAFLVATLFDHYCTRLHVGLGLESSSAVELRALIDRAVEETPGGLSRHLFRRGLVAGARATVRAPLDLADMATGGRVRRLLTRGSEIEAAAEVDEVLEEQLRQEKSFLARSVAAVELQLASDTNPFIDRLLEHFDDLWRRHMPGGVDPVNSDG